MHDHVAGDLGLQKAHLLMNQVGADRVPLDDTSCWQGPPTGRLTAISHMHQEGSVSLRASSPNEEESGMHLKGCKASRVTTQGEIAVACIDTHRVRSRDRSIVIFQ